MYVCMNVCMYDCKYIFNSYKLLSTCALKTTTCSLVCLDNNFCSFILLFYFFCFAKILCFLVFIFIFIVRLLNVGNSTCSSFYCGQLLFVVILYFYIVEHIEGIKNCFKCNASKGQFLT